MSSDATPTRSIRLADGRFVECFDPPAGRGDAGRGRAGRGDVGGRSVVVLHGGLDAVTTLRDFPAELAAATGCAVIAYDRAGHGRSTGAPSTLTEPVRYRHLEGDGLVPLLDELGLERVVLVGHSDGAAVALLGAGRQPARVDGVVALAPQLIFHEAMRPGLDAAAEAFSAGDLRSRLARHHPGEPPAGVDAVFAGWSHAWRSGGLTVDSVAADLAAIRCPVSVVVGRDDPYGFRPNARLLTDTLGVGWELRFLAGVGHNPHHDARASTLTVVRRFLEELDTGSA